MSILTGLYSLILSPKKNILKDTKAQKRQQASFTEHFLHTQDYVISSNSPKAGIL